MMPGGMTDEKAYAMVNTLRFNFAPPYSLRGYCPYTTDALDQMKPVPPDIMGQVAQSLDELLVAFRTIQPKGHWIMFVWGTAPGYDKPGAFIGTDLVERAKRYRERLGN